MHLTTFQAILDVVIIALISAGFGAWFRPTAEAELRAEIDRLTAALAPYRTGGKSVTPPSA